MKTISKIILSIFIVGVIVTVTGFAIGGRIGNIKTVNSAENYEEKSYIIQENIEEVNFILNSKNIKVEKSTDNISRLDFYINVKTEKFIVSEDGKELDLQIKHKIQFPFINYGIAPKEFQTVILKLSEQNIKALNLDVRSGNAEINDLDFLTEFSFKVNSGKGKITNLTLSTDLDIISKSSSLTLENINVKELGIYSSSGNVSLNNVNSGITSIILRSSKADIKNIDGETLSSEVNSGTLNITNSKIKKNTINSNSSNVNIVEQRKREELAFTVKASSSSISLFGVSYKEVNDIDKTVDSYYINLKSSKLKVS